MDYPISAEERDHLLAECRQVSGRIDELSRGGLASLSEQERNSVAGLNTTLARLRQQYRLHLPVLPLSRCPFSGQVVYQSIDPHGLDGFWWDYHNPVRLPTFIPSALFSFTGSLRLEMPVEDMPFLCRPGPGIPFVIPELMDADSVKAVIYSLKIGPHTGYPIVYYASPVPPGIEPVNDWGTDHWTRIDYQGAVHWNESVDLEDDYDFDLVPYLRSGKLRWIAPGDRTMTLRSGLDRCPYTDLTGERRIQRIRQKKVWTS